MKYQILSAKDDLGNDVKDKWEIINISTGNRCSNKFYDEPEHAYRDLAYLYVANDLPLPYTTTHDETRLSLLKRIIDAFNECDKGEILDIIFGDRGDFSSHGRGDGVFKISESTCLYGNKENCPCQFYEGKCKCQHYKRRS